jgi:nicotinamidase-related amidase
MQGGGANFEDARAIGRKAGAAMDAMIVVDMQVGLLNGESKHDLQGVLDRINRLTAMVRGRSGAVIWIQHCGDAGEDFEPSKPGWALLPELDRQATDLVVGKTLNDPFAGTDLRAILDEMAPERVLIAGWATDFCVDATVRSAVSNNHEVVVVSDGHTLSDRPHLDAPTVIRHHNWVWSNLISKRSIRVASAAELLEGN